MKVSLIVEGAYPYLTGGVSSWIQRMLQEFSHIEFIIQTIIVDRGQKRTIRYDIPENVSEIREIYLFDKDYRVENKKIKLDQEEYHAFETLFHGEDIEWGRIFDFFYGRNISLDELLKSKDFLELTKSHYLNNYDDIVFTDFLWSMRSMYQPLFTILKSEPVEADLYHTLATGYSGVLGSMAKYIEDKPLILSEHGIYTREREEELIKADWVSGVYKDLWINQFYKLSSCGYEFADQVTALYPGAREIQVELGCEKGKTNVIGNGVDIERFKGIPGKDKEDDWINVGAILRVAPIKDVKTMINAFHLAKISQANLKLWIMGPLDEDPEYAEECKELVRELKLKDVIFTGAVDIRKYIGKMDIMVLSSLSEGQPLVILEGFAAKKPYITTNVGDCKGLIYGNDDGLGDAGIVVPLMDTEKMGGAILKLARNEELRRGMGANGYNRADKFHRNNMIYNEYYELYMKLMGRKIK